METCTIHNNYCSAYVRTVKTHIMYLFFIYHEHITIQMLNFVAGTLLFYITHNYETFSQC